MKAYFEYQRIIQLTDMIEGAKKVLEEKPSMQQAQYIQHLQRQRQKIQANLKPTLVSGKLNESPNTQGC